MNRSRVFVVQEPYRRGPYGLERAVDITPAGKYGELIPVLGMGKAPFNTEPVIAELADKLRDFNDNDYILAIGAPSLIGYAISLAAYSNGGHVRVLQWDRHLRDYLVSDARLWDEKGKTNV